MQNRNSLWLNLIIMWSLTSHFTSQESALSSDRWTSSSAIGAESVLNGPSNGLTRAAASGQANVGRPLSLSALSIHPEHWADSEPRRGSHQGPPQGSGCIGNCQSQLLPCQSPDGKLVRWSYLAPSHESYRILFIFLRVIQICPVSPLTSPLWRLLSQDDVNSPKPVSLLPLHHTA